jgi:hypothetical protein
MLTITQGPASEYQIVIFYGIVAFLMLAPVIIAAAGLFGYLTRSTPTCTNASTTEHEAQSHGSEKNTEDASCFSVAENKSRSTLAVPSSYRPGRAMPAMSEFSVN